MDNAFKQIVQLIFVNVRIDLPVKHVKTKFLAARAIIAAILVHASKPIVSRYASVRPVLLVNFVKFAKTFAQIIHAKVGNV